MPDKRKHRGPNPQDQKYFSPDMIPRLKRAVTDFSMLLTKGYSHKSSLKLVGDHFALTDRQRHAVMRASCSDSQLQNRLKKNIPPVALSAKPILIDGYNILITVEAAISHAPIFHCRDRTYRDIASVHGSYRKVEETIPALNLIADTLNSLNVSSAHFLLDSPVSNSGRLKTLMAALAAKHDYHWQISLVPNPDTHLARSDITIATSDSAILDQCRQWTDITAQVIQHLKSPQPPWIIDLELCQT